MIGIYLLGAVLACAPIVRASNPFADYEALLPQEHSVRLDGPGAMMLSEVIAAALQNNAAIRAAARRAVMVEASRATAGALEDPSGMYRGWGVPLREPWNMNQTQHMFMLGQTFPGA